MDKRDGMIGVVALLVGGLGIKLIKERRYRNYLVNKFGDRNAESFSADEDGEPMYFKTFCPYCNYGKKIEDHTKHGLVNCFKRYLTEHPDAEESKPLRRDVIYEAWSNLRHPLFHHQWKDGVFPHQMDNLTRPEVNWLYEKGDAYPPFDIEAWYKNTPETFNAESFSAEKTDSWHKTTFREVTTDMPWGKEGLYRYGAFADSPAGELKVKILSITKLRAKSHLHPLKVSSITVENDDGGRWVDNLADFLKDYKPKGGEYGEGLNSNLYPISYTDTKNYNFEAESNATGVWNPHNMPHEYLKLESIHSAVQELAQEYKIPDNDENLDLIYGFVEDLREPYFDENGDLKNAESFAAENKRLALESAIDEWVKNNQPETKSASRVKARIFTYSEEGDIDEEGIDRNRWKTREEIFGRKHRRAFPKEGLVIVVSPIKKTKALMRHLGGLGLIPNKVHYANWKGYLVIPQKVYTAESFSADTRSCKTYTCRTEYPGSGKGSDAMRFVSFLKKIKKEGVRNIKVDATEYGVDWNTVKITFDFCSNFDLDVERVKNRLWELIRSLEDGHGKYDDLHRCIQTIAEGDEPGDPFSAESFGADTVNVLKCLVCNEIIQMYSDEGEEATIFFNKHLMDLNGENFIHKKNCWDIYTSLPSWEDHKQYWMEAESFSADSISICGVCSVAGHRHCGHTTGCPCCEIRVKKYQNRPICRDCLEPKTHTPQEYEQWTCWPCRDAAGGHGNNCYCYQCMAETDESYSAEEKGRCKCGAMTYDEVAGGGAYQCMRCNEKRFVFGKKPHKKVDKGAESHAYSYAYNEGHSDSRKTGEYRPSLSTGSQEASFKRILKQKGD